MQRNTTDNNITEKTSSVIITNNKGPGGAKHRKDN